VRVRSGLRRRTRPVLGPPRAVAIALALGACGQAGLLPSGAAAPCTPATAWQTTTVPLVANAFNPGCITVQRGAIVEFYNQDPDAHTATTVSGTPAFDLVVQPGGVAQTPRLDVANAIQVTSTFQPAMQLTIFVR
jgi:plastocyanin